jgi:NAD(P)-dependent dehydrogenase (short-subunit alcohol dehydrogenase family)
VRSLRGKVAVVTGGGSGIGRAIAHDLAGRGTTVAVADLDLESAKRVVAEVTSAGGRASAHQVDVASEAGFRTLREEVLAAHPAVDILVNNAGIGPGPKNFVDTPLSDVHRILDINLWGAIHGTSIFLPDLLARPEASLVNIGSYTGLMAPSAVVGYSTSKFAVRGFTEALRMELAGSPVTVTLVMPGVTKTALMTNSPVIDAEHRESLQRAFDKAPGVLPEVVAAGVVKGILKRRPRVLTGKDTVALDIITRLAPGRYSALLAKPMSAALKKTFGE